MYRSDAEQLIRKSIARFVDAEIIPNAQEYDNSKEYPKEILKKIADMGVFGIRYPKDRGGCGGNSTLFCIVCEELARGLMGLGATVAMQCLMGTNCLFIYGNEDMHEHYFLPAMKGEKFGCFCMTEPEAGSDMGAVSTRAEKTNDGWTINGMKTWVTSGPIADFYTVMCQTNPAKKIRGLEFFFIPRDTAGVSVSKPFDTLGTVTSKISEVSFTNVRIPDAFCLTRDGQGTGYLFSVLAEIRCMTAALAVGLQRAAMDDAIRYARERQAWGKPIGNYQLIQAKVANMAVNLEASKLMTYNALKMVDRKIECKNEASMAKYFATEAACSAADSCTRIYGAYGYSMEYPAQRHFRDTRFLLNGGGTHEILQTNIAKWVGL
ncbi:MAG: acyl-CoA dehydrogenase [Desulfobacteraceae bacterium]|nr:acyl-CoA dehydrogenase [Desulfobacteraceae bacterium]